MVDEIQDVLIGEDDKDDFEILADVIQSRSVKVILSHAEDGDILMKMLNEKIPDLLFLDIVMPCRDGKTCIKEIRADKKFDELPVIVYTSMRDSETMCSIGSTAFPGAFSTALRAACAESEIAKSACDTESCNSRDSRCRSSVTDASRCCSKSRAFSTATADWFAMASRNESSGGPGR